MFIVTCFWVVVVINGFILLDHGNLKSAIYLKNELMKLAYFLHTDTNWVSMLKHGRDHLDHGTLKSGVSRN